MLGTRLVMGFAMAGAILLVLWLDERFAPWFPIWFVLATVVLWSSALEFVGLLNATSTRASSNSVLGGILALLFANWAPHVSHALQTSDRLAGRLPYDPLAPVSVLGWPLLVFVGVVMATFLAQGVQFQRPGATLTTIAGTVLALTYVGLLGTFIVQLRWFDGPYHGIPPLVFLIATAKGADTGAYTFGRIAGRRKLWPRLSPNKTVEGAVGGMFSGVAAALIVAAVARDLVKIPTLGWATAAGFGLVVGFSAQLGDLMESMIKRDCSRKDASAAVPGFGGVLDVLDSLLFAAPIAFAYWIWLGP
ncbi:MAG: phosphatidate cytidylyltransferase [Singulisphaera sp.]|nr:phosphatidate cytidylyltransferase [Singulisphaera sp.]